LRIELSKSFDLFLNLSGVWALLPAGMGALTGEQGSDWLWNAGELECLWGRFWREAFLTRARFECRIMSQFLKKLFFLSVFCWWRGCCRTSPGGDGATGMDGFRSVTAVSSDSSLMLL